MTGPCALEVCVRVRREVEIDGAALGATERVDETAFGQLELRGRETARVRHAALEIFEHGARDGLEGFVDPLPFVAVVAKEGAL